MNIPLRIAFRYVFSKKKVNAINIISRISIAGLSIGTAALILVMSVFNGLSQVIGEMFNAFNPDLVILPVRGKTFDESSIDLQKIKNISGVEALETTLEELALFTYGDNQAFGLLKGVGEQYKSVTRIAGYMYNGQFLLRDNEIDFAVAGIGMADKLAINIYDPLRTVQVYVPRRSGSGLSTTPFRSDVLIPAGNFMIQHDYDNEIIFAPIGFVRNLLQMPDLCSSVEIKLDTDAFQSVKKQIQEIVGPDFIIKDRFEQDEAFLKIQNLEKWISFAILSFTIMLIAFNLLGVLWMIAREKSRDIAVLISMGLDASAVRKIFYYCGALYAALSILLGFSIALFLYILQKEVGLVHIPDGFAVSTYPVALDYTDFIAAAIIVSVISIAASIPAAIRAAAQAKALNELSY